MGQASSSGDKGAPQFSTFSLRGGSTLSKSHLSPSRRLCHHQNVFLETSKAHKSCMIQSVAVTHITQRTCGREMSAAPKTTGLHTHTRTPPPAQNLGPAWTGFKTCLHTSAPQGSTAIVYTRLLRVRTGSPGPLSLPGSWKKGSIQAQRVGT